MLCVFEVNTLVNLRLKFQQGELVDSISLMQDYLFDAAYLRVSSTVNSLSIDLEQEI